MTDTRAAFEAWYGKYPQDLWETWQAAIKHERSECAKVCEEKGDSAERGHFCMGNGKWARDCAAAIRARS
jgi:hypothetical protein